MHAFLDQPKENWLVVRILKERGRDGRRLERFINALLAFELWGIKRDDSDGEVSRKKTEIHTDKHC